MEEMTVRVMTPDQVIFEGKARCAHACGLNGYFTILPHHAPMVATLKDEEFQVEDMDESETYIALESAILEVEDSHVNVLAQTAAVHDKRHEATAKMEAEKRERQVRNIKSRKQEVQTELELYRLIQQVNQS